MMDKFTKYPILLFNARSDTEQKYLDFLCDLDSLYAHKDNNWLSLPSKLAALSRRLLTPEMEYRDIIKLEYDKTRWLIQGNDRYRQIYYQYMIYLRDNRIKNFDLNMDSSILLHYMFGKEMCKEKPLEVIAEIAKGINLVRYQIILERTLVIKESISNSIEGDYKAPYSQIVFTGKEDTEVRHWLENYKFPTHKSPEQILPTTDLISSSNNRKMVDLFKSDKKTAYWYIRIRLIGKLKWITGPIDKEDDSNDKIQKILKAYYIRGLHEVLNEAGYLKECSLKEFHVVASRTYGYKYKYSSVKGNKVKDIVKEEVKKKIRSILPLS